MISRAITHGHMADMWRHDCVVVRDSRIKATTTVHASLSANSRFHGVALQAQQLGLGGFLTSEVGPAAINRTAHVHGVMGSKTAGYLACVGVGEGGREAGSQSISI